MRCIRTYSTVFLLGLAALAAAAVLAFGCAHTDLGPMDTIVIPGTWERGGPDTRTVSFSLGKVSVHNIDLVFAIPMRTGSVKVSVTDGAGTMLSHLNMVWSRDQATLHLKGPFAFCQYYDVTVKAGARDKLGVPLNEDTTVTVQMVENPLDVDFSSSCKADPAISPMFTEMDAALITGDMISRQIPYKELHQRDLDKHNVFYIDYSGEYNAADRMIRVPDMSGPDEAGLAKLYLYENRNPNNHALISTHYVLYLWDDFDPLYDLPTSSIIHDIDGNSAQLKGPTYAGDLNGDGAAEILVSIQYDLGDGSAMQKVYLLKGPIAYGDGLLLTDVAGPGKLMGSTGDNLLPFSALGDIDRDGLDDVGTIRKKISQYGQVSDWEVWILRGKTDLDRVFLKSSVERITGRMGREIVDLEAADLNGDGASDLIVTELEQKYVKNELRLLNPHIGIFFGGGSLDGKTTMLPNTELRYGQFYGIPANMSVSVRALGDINGDGLDDIGILITEEDVYGRVLSSQIYLFTGRRLWQDSYFLNSNILAEDAARIDVSGNGEILWKDIYDPASGDIDNDGYNDLMVVSDDGHDRTAYWFFGGPVYSTLGNRWNLDDADVIWTFREQ